MKLKRLAVHLLDGNPLVFETASRPYRWMDFGFNSLTSEAPDAIRSAFAMTQQTQSGRPGDYYEFGVFKGYTVHRPLG